MTLLELADEVERAEGADRRLDARIAIEAAGFFICKPRWAGAPASYGYIGADGVRHEPGHGGMQLVPAFTASLDAAATLVPDGYSYNVGKTDDGAGYASIAVDDGAMFFEEPDECYWESAATTPALALAAAALRARAAIKG